MNNNLSPESEAFLTEVVAKQEFASRDAAIEAAIGLMRRRRDLLHAVDAGTDQLNSGIAHRYAQSDLDRFLADVGNRENQRSATG